MASSYVDLDRRFIELSPKPGAGDADVSQWERSAGPFRWAGVLERERVLILAEAGAGKTEEIQQQAIRLRKVGKPAFFLRIENIRESFEDAFEVGAFEDFDAWRKGCEEGWVFLDSIDEARLRSPREFELALRAFAREVKPAVGRLHLVITGRVDARYVHKDLAVCGTALPRERERAHVSDGEENVTVMSREPEDPHGGYRVLTLTGLDKGQVTTFLKEKGVADPEDLLRALTEAEFMNLTTRPQDLIEVIGYWEQHHRLGGRSEMLEAGIAYRLAELNAAHADRQAVTPAKLRSGAQMLAALTVLTKDPLIRRLDGLTAGSATDLDAVLCDWTVADREALLARPIFEPPSYGTVRFHHRRVREYLAAARFADLLQRAPLRRIEGLFFREQYGERIIPPALRPTLSWLILKDERIRKRALALSPELAFEGGDPLCLPAATRAEVLRAVCENLAAGTKRRSAIEWGAVERFAHPDIGGAVVELLATYRNDPDVAFILLKIIARAPVSAACPTVLEIARDRAADVHCRRVAIEAARVVATVEDLEALREAFAGESSKLDPYLLAGFIRDISPDQIDCDWLFRCLHRVPELDRYSSDGLREALLGLLGAAPAAILRQVLVRSMDLLDLPPDADSFAEEVPVRYAWLLSIMAAVSGQLIALRDPVCLEPGGLMALRTVELGEWFRTEDLRESEVDFPALIGGWPELNRAAFWHEVGVSRALRAPKGTRLTLWWDVSVRFGFWRFRADDFPYLIEQVRLQPEPDDRLVALSWAFTVFHENQRPPEWLVLLREVTEGEAELESFLHRQLHFEESAEEKALKVRRATVEAQQVEREAEIKAREQRIKDDIRDNLIAYKTVSKENPGEITTVAYNMLLHVMSSKRAGGRWAWYDWRVLVEPFGEDSARYYRDAAVAFWRQHKPQLRSEGFAMDKTANVTVFGLNGLEIESREAPAWLRTLSPDEIDKACRYASFELNGFPTWFQALYEAHPVPVAEFLMQETLFDLAQSKPGDPPNYIVSDLAWAGQWAWERLGPRLLIWLEGQEPQNVLMLGLLLKVVQGSPVGDELLARLAAGKCRALVDVGHLGRWFAVWAGVAPAEAVEVLEARLEALTGADEQLQLVMVFVTQLFGGNAGWDGGVRKGFLKPGILLTLFKLVSRHVKSAEDVQRANLEVHSPELRDHAQDARDRLFRTLQQLPGKAAYLAVRQLVDETPERPWYRRLAYEKAEADGDLTAFTSTGVREFWDAHERAPRTHADLADLAEARLLDFKDEVERGDDSPAETMKKIGSETELRNFIAREMRARSADRYTVHQEEEKANSQRTDIRFAALGCAPPVPVELKLLKSGAWSGAYLSERLENQLCGDYLREAEARRGIFLLVSDGSQTTWELPDKSRVRFPELIAALQAHWQVLSPSFLDIDDIRVIGIDLSERGKVAGRAGLLPAAEAAEA